jgi:Mce-associated membrane protein
MEDDADGHATSPEQAKDSDSGVDSHETTDDTEVAEQSEELQESDGSDDDARDANPVVTERRLNQRPVIAVGVLIGVALAGLTGWLGYRAHESQAAEDQSNLFVQVARQGALNLTTIDHAEVDKDVQRILDTATGNFFDDFQKRSPAFVQVVKAAQSKSVGSVTEAGLESVDGHEGQVLVAVTVQTSTAAAAEQRPRSWRMRIHVEKVNDSAKVSNVEFVP